MRKIRDNFTARMWTVSKLNGICGVKPIIVQTSQNVTLVGAGQVSKGDFDIALTYAPYLIAADGGAELVLNYGRTPKKVIGDFDSLDRQTLAGFPADSLHQIDEQDSTDFEKCLRNIAAPLILGLGFLGGRLDHQLAACNALVQQNGSPCVLIGETDLIFHAPHPLALPLAPGTRLSLFPMAAVRGQSKGLKWPVDGLDMSPGGQIGVSNVVTSSPVHLNFEMPGLLVILPKECLPVAIAALVSNSPVPGR